MCDSKGFTMAESLLVLCLTSFLMLLITVRAPSVRPLDQEVERIKEMLIRLQMLSMQHHRTQDFRFDYDQICLQETCYPYTKGVTSDVFAMKFYEDGTISQAKKICFYQKKATCCMYMQLGSGRIDIR